MSNNIEMFTLEYKEESYRIYIIKNRSYYFDDNKISIIIETDNNLYSYSKQLFLNNIINNRGEQLNILSDFFEKKVIILEKDEKEISLGIISNTAYRNLEFIKIKEKTYIRIKVKKNEYYIIWRDPNFESKNYYKKHLEDRKLFCLKEANLNIYERTSTENTLQFIKERQNDKIIFISSIGLDLSGKRFIEIARKILGFNFIVLFYSNNIKHFEWIKDFPNCLYTDKKDIYEEYITNFTENGLKNLKIKDERKYHNNNLSLREFTQDFISYPNSNNIFIKDYKEYFNKVKICCYNKKYLCMSDNGIVYSTEEEDEASIWFITILEKTITLNSNKFYLKEENRKVKGNKYMEIWDFGRVRVKNENQENIYYYFRVQGRKDNNILSMEGSTIKANKQKVGKMNEIFKLIDCPFDSEDSFDESFLSQSICDSLSCTSLSSFS